MTVSREFAAKSSSIPDIITYISEYLKNYSMEEKEKNGVLLRAEDALNEMILKCGDPAEKLTVSIKQTLPDNGKIYLYFSCRGESMSMRDIEGNIMSDDWDEDIKEILQSRLLPFVEKNLSIRHHNGRNEIRIVARAKINRIKRNVMLLVLGLVLGILIRNILPASVNKFIANDICSSIVTIFFNLLKMLIVPIVFCSMTASVGEFSDLKQLGRIGARTISYFVAFSLVGIVIGYGVFQLLPCGSENLLSMVAEGADSVSSTQPLSLWENVKSVIIGIFPSNIVDCWLKNDILSVIFLAILFGSAIRELDNKESEKVRNVFKVLNDLICHVTAKVVGMMPLVVLCSMMKIAISLEFNEAADLLMYFGDMLIGFAIMFVIFTVVLAVKGISPRGFYRNFAPTLFMAFSLASSSAVIPTSLDCCEKAGISKKISNFVIPLGATINMNGSCVTLMVTCLFIARCYGVAISPDRLAVLMLMILIFAMAAPGVPGSMIVMLASLLAMLEIPAESVNIIIAVSSMVGMFMVPVNSMGDALVSVLMNDREGF